MCVFFHVLVRFLCVFSPELSAGGTQSGAGERRQRGSSHAIVAFSVLPHHLSLNCNIMPLGATVAGHFSDYLHDSTMYIF